LPFCSTARLWHPPAETAVTVCPRSDSTTCQEHQHRRKLRLRVCGAAAHSRTLHVSHTVGVSRSWRTSKPVPTPSCHGEANI
jgi:hypothetical protein